MLEKFHSFKEAGIIKHGLPASAYIDPDFLKIENERLFLKNWVFVGFSHELSNIGDAQPVTVADKPLLLIRGDAGDIKAFHNVCRHRCLKLVDAPKNCGQLIRCPYHSWVYDLNGRLKATPFFLGKGRGVPEEFSLEDNGLVSVNCGVWHDWIFVNLSDNPPVFDDFIRPIAELLGDINFSDIKAVATLDFGEVKTNWKLLMENFIEPYHVQFVHKTTTSQPLVDHYTIIKDHCLGSACDIDETESHMQNTLAVTSRYLTLFPNFVIGTYAPDQIGVHLNSPISINKTHQRRVIYFHKDSAATAEYVEETKHLWYAVHKEDHEMCERLQIGRQSPVAEQGGNLSPHWEDSVRRFQELVFQSTFD